MNPFTGTTFGIGTPTISPFAQQSTQAFPQQPGGSYGIGLSGIGTAPSSPLQQTLQLLQTVPQQLQQVQQLQQQQFQHLQLLLQWVPAQLQQLQQLIQALPHQVQQLQQQGQPFGAGISGPLAFGLVPPAFAGQATGQVM